jgi:hypothetical protein
MGGLHPKVYADTVPTVLTCISHEAHPGCLHLALVALTRLTQPRRSSGALTLQRLLLILQMAAAALCRGHRFDVLLCGVSAHALLHKEADRAYAPGPARDPADCGSSTRNVSGPCVDARRCAHNV